MYKCYHVKKQTDIPVSYSLGKPYFPIRGGSREHDISYTNIPQTTHFYKIRCSLKPLRHICTSSWRNTNVLVHIKSAQFIFHNDPSIDQGGEGIEHNIYIYFFSRRFALIHEIYC